MRTDSNATILYVDDEEEVEGADEKNTVGTKSTPTRTDSEETVLMERTPTYNLKRKQARGGLRQEEVGYASLLHLSLPTAFIHLYLLIDDGRTSACKARAAILSGVSESICSFITKIPFLDTLRPSGSGQ